jgi:hypothetical protein
MFETKGIKNNIHFHHVIIDEQEWKTNNQNMYDKVTSKKWKRQNTLCTKFELKWSGISLEDSYPHDSDSLVILPWKKKERGDATNQEWMWRKIQKDEEKKHFMSNSTFWFAKVDPQGAYFFGLPFFKSIPTLLVRARPPRGSAG